MILVRASQTASIRQKVCGNSREGTIQNDDMNQVSNFESTSKVNTVDLMVNIVQCQETYKFTLKQMKRRLTISVKVKLIKRIKYNSL